MPDEHCLTPDLGVISTLASMQSLMSAFKRSSDKKHKRLLQDSLLSSTDVSFSNDENVRPQESFSSRADSLKPKQLLHTPSPGRGTRKASASALHDHTLQELDNNAAVDTVGNLLLGSMRAATSCVLAAEGS